MTKHNKQQAATAVNSNNNTSAGARERGERARGESARSEVYHDFMNAALSASGVCCPPFAPCFGAGFFSVLSGFACFLSGFFSACSFFGSAAFAVVSKAYSLRSISSCGCSSQSSVIKYLVTFLIVVSLYLCGTSSPLVRGLGVASILTENRNLC